VPKSARSLFAWFFVGFPFLFKMFFQYSFFMPKAISVMAPSSNTAQKGQDYSYVGTYSECLCAGHCFRSTSRQARNRLGLDSFQHSRVHITLLLLCEEQKRQNAARVKRYWEIIADNLSKAGWSWGCVSAIDFQRANDLDC
jgi:hypothetical protein